MITSIEALIAAYIVTQTQQAELRDAPNHVYNSQSYYEACDDASRIVFQMINHPDWTIDLESKYYDRKGEIPYPVSC